MVGAYWGKVRRHCLLFWLWSKDLWYDPSSGTNDDMACRWRDDMRKQFNGLSALAESVVTQDPYSGHLFVFRGSRGDLVKIVWWDGLGACMFSKRLEKGKFV